MNQSAPKTTPKQVETFYAYLEKNAQGQANAKTARQIAHELQLGKNGDRILRALAHKATEQGLLICTGNDGYWLPTSPEEAEETIGRITSQGANMMARAKELRALVAQKFAVPKHRRAFNPNQLQLGL